MLRYALAWKPGPQSPRVPVRAADQRALEPVPERPREAFAAAGVPVRDINLCTYSFASVQAFSSVAPAANPVAIADASAHPVPRWMASTRGKESGRMGPERVTR
jgi:hypothetical protein